MKKRVVLLKDAKVYFYRKINSFLFRNKNLSIKYFINGLAFLNKKEKKIEIKFTDYMHYRRM
jgi:hypothetical protein